VWFDPEFSGNLPEALAAESIRAEREVPKGTARLACRLRCREMEPPVIQYTGIERLGP
jgi:hypothetical protein